MLILEARSQHGSGNKREVIEQSGRSFEEVHCMYLVTFLFFIPE